MTSTTDTWHLDEDLTRQLMVERILVLGTELNETTGNRLCSQLVLLSAQDPRREISLWINSPGGSVPAMLAIRDLIRLLPIPVSTLALGLACSAGQFLLSSGTPGRRFALPHARILMHQGSAGIGGTAVDVEIQAEDLRHTRDTVLGLIAEDTGQPLERVRADSERDRWFTAPQAQAYGFIDGIVDDLAAVRPPLRTPIGVTA